MSETVDRDELMRYLDGELSPAERSRVEERLSASTELRRQVILFRAMKGDLQELSFEPLRSAPSVWDRIQRRVTRPVGWLLLVTGSLAWVLYGAYVYVTSQVEPLEKIATAAVVVGILLLLAAVIRERYREWLEDPYRDVHR